MMPVHILKCLPDIKLILLTIDLRLLNIQIFDNTSSRFQKLLCWDVTYWKKSLRRRRWEAVPEPDKKSCFVCPEVKKCMALQNLEIYGILPTVQHLEPRVPMRKVGANDQVST
jgi:hypothetical protein